MNLHSLSEKYQNHWLALIGNRAAFHWKTLYKDAPELKKYDLLNNG